MQAKNNKYDFNFHACDCGGCIKLVNVYYVYVYSTNWYYSHTVIVYIYIHDIVLVRLLAVSMLAVQINL